MSSLMHKNHLLVILSDHKYWYLFKAKGPPQVLPRFLPLSIHILHCRYQSAVFYHRRNLFLRCVAHQKMGSPPHISRSVNSSHGHFDSPMKIVANFNTHDECSVMSM